MLYTTNILIKPGFEHKLIAPEEQGFYSKLKKLFVTTEHAVFEELSDVSDILKRISLALTECELTNLVRMSHDDSDFYLDTEKKPHDLGKVLEQFRMDVQSYYERFFEEIAIVLEDTADGMNYSISISLSRLYYPETFPIRFRISATPVSVDVKKPQERFALMIAKIEQSLRKYMQIGLLRVLNPQTGTVSDERTIEYANPKARHQNRPDSASNSECQFFPLYDVTLGVTTISELEQLGSKATDINASTNRPYDYFRIKGMNFWHHGTTASHLYLTYSDPLPRSWMNCGWDWQLSYNDWIKLLEKQGFHVLDAHKPKTERYDGKLSLTAELMAEMVLPNNLTLTVECDFSYSQKTGLDTEGTLYSLRILAS